MITILCIFTGILLLNLVATTMISFRIDKLESAQSFMKSCLFNLHVGEVNHILSMASMYKANGKEEEHNNLLVIAEKFRKLYNITDEELNKAKV